MAKKIIVSIVIPTRDRPKQLGRLLHSIEQNHYPELEILVIQDGGTTQLTLPPKVISIHHPQPQGLAAARTAGARKAQGKYILFIDDDNIVAPDMIKTLVASFSLLPQLCAVGPHTFYYQQPTKQWFLGVDLNLATSKAHFDQIVDESKLLTKHLYRTQNLHNCFMVKKAVGDQVGWFDPKVWMSGTEFDLFQKIKKLYPDALLATNLQAKCYHDVPVRSTHLLRSLGFDTPYRVYYFARNRGLLAHRYGSWLDKWLLSAFFYPFFTVAYLLLFVWYRKITFITAHLQGTRAGYKFLWQGEK